MARVNYPEEFLRQVKLFKVMKAKHDADLPDSVLVPFLNRNNIDLNADATATANALTKDLLFDKKDRDAEKFTKRRDKLFNPVLSWMKKELQFLKRFYAGDSKELGDWGATVDENRIVYPPEFEELVQLFKDIKTQHESYGPGDPSPLGPFLTKHGIDLVAQLSDVEDAEDINDQRNQTQKDAEDAREDRDNLFDPVMDRVRLIAQYLKTLNVDNPRELGEWGYVIDDSPRDPKFRTGTVNAASTRTLLGVKLNSQVENTGEVPLLLHKGKEIGPEPFTLHPEMRFTIKRGFGTLTVENPDPAQAGEIGWITVNTG